MVSIHSATSTGMVTQSTKMYEITSKSDKHTAFTIKPEHLAKNECHFFFDINSKARAMAAAIEFFLFPPSNPELNNKFNLALVPFEFCPYFYCSFPKSYVATCLKFAKFYDLKPNLDGRIALIWGEHNRFISINFPKSDCIFWFEGPKFPSKEASDAECDAVVRFSKDMDKLGVD